MNKTHLYIALVVALIILGFSYFIPQNFYKTPDPVFTSDVKSNKSVPKDLTPYLANAGYCEENNDCVIKTYYCSTGSYNTYNKKDKESLAFGCERGDQSITDQDMQICNLEVSHPSLYYGEARCVKNKCTSSERKIICNPGAYVEPI